MARNEEKSQSMLNRWLQLEKSGGDGAKPKEKQKRPYLAELCVDLQDAQKWRMQIIKEIGRNVMLIQNTSLEEHKIRDLNDLINKLLREKYHWERRVIELGGPDLRSGPPIAEDESDVGAIKAPGNYYYFGAAKNLPGVRELLKPKKQDVNRRTRYDMYQRIDADYYGFRDDEDGLLQKLEAEAELKAREKVIAEWNEAQISKYGSLEACPYLPKNDESIEYKVHVALPTQEEINLEILNKRKEEVMKKFAL
jgi:pre-mRNA-splicing factor ISY1